MSEAAVATMTEQEAQKLTERIRVTAVNYADARQKLQELVSEAKKGNAHIALGYSSWTAYLSEVLGEEPMRLARGERQEMVQLLSSEGMTSRAIAPIVGASDRQVRYDVAGGKNCPPEPAEPALSDEPGQVSKLTGADSAATVTGMDGKTYTRPEPKPSTYFDAETGEVTTGDIEAAREPAKPRRRPITDRANEAGWELRKTTEKIQRIYEDDRFSSNKEQVATYLRGHLQNTVKVCQDLLDQIN